MLKWTTITLMVILMANLATAATVVLYHDSFEGNAFTNWTVGVDWKNSTSVVKIGSRSAMYDGPTNDDALTLNIDLDGSSYSSCTVKAWLYLAAANDNGEYIAVGYSTDGGGGWTEFEQIDGNTDTEDFWHQPNATIATPTNQIRVRFRGKNNAGANEFAYTDNLTILCEEAAPVYNPNITYTGDCDVECNVTTSYYTAVIKEGILWNLSYNHSDEGNSYFGRTITGTNNAGLNGIFNAAGTGIMAATITATSSANISGNNSNNLNITFYNTNAWQKYKFYQQYYITEALASTSAMRYYYFLNNGTQFGKAVGDDLVFNSSNRMAAQTSFTDSEASDGLVAAVYNLSITNYTFNVLFNYSLTTDYDYQASGGATSGMGIAIARSSEIAQGAILTTINEVMKRNTSASTFDTSVTDMLKKLKADRDIFTAGPATCYTTTTGLIIIPADCYFSLSSAMLEALI